MKNTKLLWIIGVIIIATGLFGWSKIIEKSDTSVIARNGIHWHPQLTIYVDGVPQEIPANIGLIGGHRPMHTHEEDASQGIIHLEFEGVVRQDDIRISNFFHNWNKDMMTAFGALDHMIVNGEENAEYEEYRLQPEDKVELFYISGEGETGTSLKVPAPGVGPNSVDEMIVNTSNENSEE